MQETFDTEVNPTDFFTNNRNQQRSYRNFKRNLAASSLNFSVPKMIGYFSVNELREFVPDASQLRYLKMPRTSNVQFDLNNGIENFRPKPESVKQERMDFLLSFIVKNVEKVKVKNGYRCHNKLLNPDIICSRGRLVQIMCSQCKNHNKWSLLVSKYKGNIYISQPDGTDDHTKHTAYGFKFEQYLVTGTFLQLNLLKS